MRKKIKYRPVYRKNRRKFLEETKKEDGYIGGTGEISGIPNNSGLPRRTI